MGSEAGKSVFAKRRKAPVLILASGDKVRHLTVKPWMTALGIAVAATLTVGYFGATTYLVLRDDLLGASIARQARIQHEYEDRISALRAQVDRVTSRQLLDQQVVEKKVEKLMERQSALTDRHGKINELIERAESVGAAQPEIPVPATKPTNDDRRASADSPFDAILGPDAKSETKTAGIDPITTRALGFAPTAAESPANRADRIFSNVSLSLKSIEQQQMAKIDNLRLGASEKADAIATILRRTGIQPKDGDSTEDTGGPYIPVSNPTGDKFDLKLTQLDLALQRLQEIRSQAMRYPFGNPIPGAMETSGFGYRKDPFLGTLALHPGIDFRGSIGDPARSTGAGVVISAGPASGYGNLVEIDHGNGITTRYGHLSEILVRVGQHVDTGDMIGRVGNTGRSTGPHLHYEVRRNGVAIDPSGFLNAGLKITSLL
ncbi:M23 family metallopeptidase [Rhizobium sp. C1]|uniref:M23 family metallopeptidase n=1 Tax=Rhizobium sp. C1 TaxID=1349799 RepID=UPI001E4CE33E|nr:M23 family metallopeptidase [Rhizobium sp. C1]MCD2176882.1 M23 family metallopeptidase [Rhizobium sp. C1]